jgi:fatty-acyl-CoA synthase
MEFKNITMGEMLEETAKKYPLHKAVKYIEMEFNKTWYEFNDKVDRIAKGLMGMGLKKGDHVAVWATNYPQWLVLMFATAKIGVVLVTVNTNYKSHELKFQLEQSDSKFLFICDGLKDIDCEKIIYSICPELKTFDKRKALYSESAVFGAFPKLRAVISFDNSYKGMFHWNDIEYFNGLVSSTEYNERKASLHPDDVINMQYTSGTTGFPKGVMLTHNNIVNNGFAIGECMRFTENDKLCIPVPFFHCFGMVLAIMACVTHGSTMLPLLWYTPMKVMHVVEYEKCTAVHGVPTMFIGILEHHDFAEYNFSSLRTGIMAGSPCPIKVMEDVLNKMHMTEICITYGQTEASPAITMSSTTDSIETRVGTVGRPMPGVEVKVINRETGETLPDNIAGELCARGYNIMKGYYKMPEATEAAIDSDGWLHTGDLAIRLPDGNYKITGRARDMIIRGGENIYPKEIEDFIYTHPKVKDVQVVGVPSKTYGEEIMACVILKDNESATQEEIQKFVLKSMAKHKVPGYVSFVDSFPMTASGKIQKYILRDRAVEALGLQEANAIETA